MIGLLCITGCTQPELAVRQPPPLGFVDGTVGSTTSTKPDSTSSTMGSSPSTETTPTSSTSTTTTSSTTGSTTSSTTITTTGTPPLGIDVSHWNDVTDWNTVAGAGMGFAIVKATEGTYYISDTFADQYDGAYDAGLIHGAYHFANPRDSGGVEQADFFVDYGGGWSADGQTLPGTLDIEWDPYTSDACYGLSQSEMIDWMFDFLDQYAVRTGRDAVIYTAASWWSQCVNTGDFAAWPLWVAHYGVSSPNLPVGWSEYTFWQDSGYGSVSGVTGNVDTDVFGGSPDELYHFALDP